MSTASLISNRSDTGKRLRSLRVGVICSNLRFSDKMGPEKFCTCCKLWILVLLVPDQTVELSKNKGINRNVL